MITDEYLPAWQKLRDRIAEVSDEKWNIESYCGTTCCLAGHACLMEGLWTDRIPTVECNAVRILGIENDDEAFHVFCGGWFWDDDDDERLDKLPSRKDAVCYLDKAIAERNPMVTI